MGEQQPSQQGEHSTAEHAPETEHESEEEPPAEQNSDDKPEDWAAETGPSRFATWQWCQKKRCWEWELMGAAAVILWLVFFLRTQELSWSSRFTMMFPGVAAEKKVFTPNQPLG